jgi:hypothetical protein
VEELRAGGAAIERGQGALRLSLVGDGDDHRYVVCQRNGKGNGRSTKSFCIRTIVKVADNVYVVGEQQIRDLEQTPDLCAFRPVWNGALAASSMYMRPDIPARLVSGGRGVAGI